MGFFELSQKKDANSVVWKSADGQITCPGDSCPKDCDETCPIYLNTQALMLIQKNQDEKAISLYEKALAIAPNFYDAWNNLAGVYGSQGD